MSQRKTTRTILLLLVFCLLLSFMPSGVIVQATEAETEASAAAVVTPGTDSAAVFQLEADCQILSYVDEEVFTNGNHVARLKDQEDLDTYVFLNADGTQTVYYMDENIKFRDENGVVREKDITLTATTTGYTTTRNNVGLSLPADLAQGITLSFGGYDVSMIPENISTATTVQQQDGKVTYLNCYGKGTGLIYTPTLSGFKEDILLAAYTGVNSFSFLFNTDGLQVYQNEQGRYYLAQSQNAAVKMEMADIVAYDANARHSLGTVTVTPITAGQQYRLTVTVDEAFLTAESTAYPVLIDPSITVSDNTHGANAIEDATVYSGQPNLNTGTWTYNHAGYYDDTYGVARTVVRLTGMLSSSIYQSLTASQIQSAHFYLTEASGSNYAAVILLAMNSNASWTENSITWNNVGSYNLSSYDSVQMGWLETGAYDITNLVKEWRNGSYSNGQYGFILKGNNETSIDKALYASEHGTTACRPYVVVNYSLPSSAYYINEGLTTTLTVDGVTDPITWTSNNASVASVDSSGLVTCHRAGKATITATAGGLLQKTFAIYVTLPDGTYYISSGNTSPYLTADIISYENNMPLKLCGKFNTKAQTDLDNHSDFPERFGQIWLIQHTSGGYYTISALYKDGLYVRATSESTVALWQGIGSFNQWEIKWNGSSYNFFNRWYSDYALAWMPDSEAGQHSTTMTTDSTDRHACWEITSTTVEGLLLVNSQTGERADTGTKTPIIMSPPSNGNQTLSLVDLNLEVKVFDNINNSQVLAWDSSNTNVATVNLTTGTLTVKSSGSTIISAICSIGGRLHKTSYKLSVIGETISVDVLYDAKYASTFPDVTTRLTAHMQELQRIYMFHFDKYIDFSQPQQRSFLTDTCQTLGADDQCNCGIMSGYGNCAHPHSNLSNILDSMELPDGDKSIAFIGHDTCYGEGTEHNFNSDYPRAMGVGEVGGRRACVSMTTVTGFNDALEVLVATHEFGHLLGARDHYGDNCPTTEETNAAAEEQGLDSDLFNELCVFGEQHNDADVVEDLIFCNGCQKVINGEIAFPSINEEES